MQDMRDKLILGHLQDLGFSANDVQIIGDDVVFKDFHSDVVRGQLHEEGALIQNYGRDNHYHNYVYPDGLIPGFAQITIKKHTAGLYYSAENPVNTRINTISIPLAAIQSEGFSPQEFVDRINLTHDTHHTFRVSGSPPQMELTVDYSAARGKVPAEELLRGLLTELQPRIPHKADIKGPNYISHLGRLAHMLHASAMDQAMNRLTGAPNQEGYLLGLRDHVVSSPERPTMLKINKSVFRRWVEKEAREEQLLSRKVAANLNMDATNWVAVDLRQLRYPKERSLKFQAALARKDDPNNPPLYMSTTTGQHAFAMMIDFKNKTVFLANPLGTYDNFAEIVEQVKLISGCDKVVHVNTQPLAREGDIPFQDVCTADSVALAHMMQTYHAAYGTLKADCLNGQKLKTAEYVTRQGQEVRAPAPAMPPVDQKMSHTRYRESPAVSQDHSYSVLRSMPDDRLERQRPQKKATEMIERPKVAKELPEKIFVRKLNALRKQIVAENMSAEEGWVEATKLLERQKDYVSRDTKSGVRSVQYTADMGHRSIKKMVPEEAQIILDRLYAKKLAADDDNQYRP